MNRVDALAIARSRQVVSSEGKYRAKITNNGVYYDPSVNDPETNQPPRYLFGTNVMSSDQYSTLKHGLNPENEVDDLQELLNQTSLTAAILEPRNGGEPEWMPVKGEIVDVEVGFVPSSEGEQVLRITSITPRKAVAAQTASFDFDNEEETQEVSQEQTVVADELGD